MMSMEHGYAIRQLVSLGQIFEEPYAFMKRSEAANNVLLGLLLSEKNKPGTFDNLSFYVVYKDEKPVLCAMQTEKRGIRYPLLLSALSNKAEQFAVQCLAQYLAQGGASISEIAGFSDVVSNFTDLQGWNSVGRQSLYVLHNLPELPKSTTGRIRAATERDLTIAQDWYLEFMRDVRQPAATPQHVANYKDVITGMVAANRLFMWETSEALPVSMAGIIRESETICVVGPVYSPEESRGRGYASHLVVALCSLIFDRKKKPCLFADTWNPTSNRMYLRIGFEPIGIWERWQQNKS